jgi:tetratricopeptide (TPR) repeat protein
VFGYRDIADSLIGGLHDGEYLMRMAAVRALICVSSDKLDPLNVVSAVTEAMHDTEDVVAMMAAHGFQYLWRRPTYQPVILRTLLDLLSNDSEHPKIRGDILWAFKSIGAEAVRRPEVRAAIVAVLLEVNEKQETRWRFGLGSLAALALASLGQEMVDYPEVVGGLCRVLRDAGDTLREQAAWTLAEAGERLTSDTDVGSLLLKVMHSDEPMLRLAAAYAIERTRIFTSVSDLERVRLTLAEGLTDCHLDEKRVKAAHASLRLGSRLSQHSEILRVLLDSLVNKEESVRTEADNAFRSVAGDVERLQEACDVLVNVLRGEELKHQMAAGRALGIIAETQASRPELQAALNLALGSSEVNAQCHAALALEKMRLGSNRTDEVWWRLRSYIDSENLKLRLAAIRWVARCGLGDGPKVCAALIRDLNNPEPEVRTQVANTLASLADSGIRIFSHNGDAIRWTTVRELSSRLSQPEMHGLTRLLNMGPNNIFSVAFAQNDQAEEAITLQADLGDLYQKVIETLIHRGQLDDAIVAYRRVIELHPDSSTSHYGLGIVLAQKGQSEEAIAAYRAAIAHRPDFWQAYHNLALALTKTGQFDDAIVAYRKVLELDPNNVNGHFGLGIALAQKGQIEDAIAAYRATIALQPNHADAHFNLALALTTSGQLDDAIVAYRKVVELDPDNVKGHFGLGIVLYQKGQIEGAIAAHRAAITHRPDFWQAHYNLALALATSSQLDDAIVAYRKVVELDPDNVKGHFGLGIVLNQKGQIEDAIAAYRATIALQPNHAEAHYNLGIAFEGNRQNDEAIAQYRNALALKPEDTATLKELSSVLVKLHRYDEAIPYLEGALQTDPDDAETLNELGWSLANVHRYDQAIPYLERALRIKPDEPNFLDSIAFALAGMGQYEAAVKMYRQALVGDPQHAPFHLRLAQALNKLGRAEEAKREFDEAYRLSPELKPTTEQVGPNTFDGPRVATNRDVPKQPLGGAVGPAK